METVSADEVKALLRAAIESAGGCRALARAAGVSPAFVSACSTGRCHIAGDLARFLGVERVTVYRRLP